MPVCEPYPATPLISRCPAQGDGGTWPGHCKYVEAPREEEASEKEEVGEAAEAAGREQGKVQACVPKGLSPGKAQKAKRTADDSSC